MAPGFRLRRIHHGVFAVIVLGGGQQMLDGTI